MPNGVLFNRLITGALSMPAAIADPSVDPSWYRADGSRKGSGFLGVLQAPNGQTSTEISIGVNIDGKDMEIPSLVPTLTQEEINHLVGGGEPIDAIVQKAVDFAKQRISNGLSVFAD